MNQNCKFLDTKTCKAYMEKKDSTATEEGWCCRCPFVEEWNEPPATNNEKIVKLIIKCEGMEDINMGGSYDPEDLKWLIMKETGGKIQLHNIALDKLFKPIGGQEDKGDVFTEK